LQTRKIATTKSSALSSLLTHVSILFLSLIPVTIIYGYPIYFPIIYCALHGIQDWFIWRGYKKLLSIRKNPPVYYEDHLFYTTIGLDQLLHTIALLAIFFTLDRDSHPNWCLIF
jgi:hypothetical protein